MATFDPRIEVGLNAGGVASFGSAPNTTSLYAGQALGRIVSALQLKRDANAANRGKANADAHIGEAIGDILQFKGQNLTSISFDDDYAAFTSNKLEEVKQRNNYAPNNEKEREHYRGRIESFKLMERTRAFGEAATAFQQQQVGIVNQNLQNAENIFVAAPDDNAAAIAAADTFSTIHEASLAQGKYPGVITAEQGAIKFNESMRRASISRVSAQLPVRELFELGHTQGAAIFQYTTTPQNVRDGNFGGELSRMVLSQAEKDGIVAYALKRQKDEFDLESGARKLSDEMVHTVKTQQERDFYDATSLSKGFVGPEMLNQLRASTRPDGTPMFSGGELKVFEDYVRMVQKENVLEQAEPIVSNMAVKGALIEQIIDPTRSNPTPTDIYSDRRLSTKDRDAVVSTLLGEIQRSRTQDQSDFARRRSDGVKLLKAAIGGDAFIELTSNGKTFWGDLLSSYIARVEKRYTEALQAGNGLASINTQDIVNQIVEERSADMNNIFFPDIRKQVRSLSLYINKLPADISDQAPLSVLLDQVVQDMEEPGHTPHRGALPRGEAIRMLQILKAAQGAYANIGDLKESLKNDLTFDPRTDGKPDLPSGGIWDAISGFFKKD